MHVLLALCRHERPPGPCIAAHPCTATTPAVHAATGKATCIFTFVHAPPCAPAHVLNLQPPNPSATIQNHMMPCRRAGQSAGLCAAACAAALARSA